MNEVTIDTGRSPGALARAIARPRPVNLALMSGPRAARTLMLAQLPVEPSRVAKQPTVKLTSRERRLIKMRAGKLNVTADGRLVGVGA